MDLLGVGQRWWLSVTTHCNNHTPPNHNLKGRPPKGKWNEMYANDLINHFEELRKEAAPIATRFVQERTPGEITERDTNVDAVYLSPHWSKRQCYYNFCATLGVKVVSNSRCARIMSRIIVDEELGPGEEKEEAPSADDSSASSTSSHHFDAGTDPCSMCPIAHGGHI
jgi:hypothetical protein